jgi:selenocysteine lyase/cysteine desulfurase
MIVSKTGTLAARVWADFPALQQTIYGQPAIYLDNTETLQEKSLGMSVLF